MQEKKNLPFSWYGLILGAVMAICLTCACAAALSPAFEMENQNGMPGTDFPMGDYVIFTDVTDQTSVMAHYWTLTKYCGGDTETGTPVVIWSSPTATNYTFGPVACDEACNTYPCYYSMNLSVISDQYPWAMTSMVRNFTVSDYGEYIRANFSYSVDYEVTPANVTFFDLSEADNRGLINEWYWTIDGEELGDSKSPIFSKELSDGTYLVNLTVRDKSGDIASISKGVVISPVRATYTPTPTPTPVPIAADFSVKILKQTRTPYMAPLQVQFFDLSSGSPVAWNWNFGDQSNSTQKSPIHNYLRPGSYTVTQTVYDSNKVAYTRQKGPSETGIIVENYGVPFPKDGSKFKWVV